MAYGLCHAPQKQRRLEPKITHADKRHPAGYQALKAEMATAGHTIGAPDLDEVFANDPLRRHELMKAGVQRWAALWGITKIVVGGAILVALAQSSQDNGRAA